MTDNADQRHPSLWPLVRVAGQIVAYAAAPLSLMFGPVLAVPNVLAPLYVIAAIGLLAIFRGAVVPRLVLTTGYVFVGWYVVLVALELFHDGVFRVTLSYQADILVNGFLLLAFPFLVVGLREIRVDMRILEGVIMACLLLAALLSLYQLLFTDMVRPSGLSTNPNPFALICLVWGLCLLARALASPLRWTPLAFACVGVIPIILSGSKNGWLGAILGYGGLFLAWAWETRRWVAAGVTVAAAIPLAWAVSRVEIVSERIAELTWEIGGFVTTGDTSGSSVGLRFSADLGGLRAFLDQPFLGYGMSAAKLAAAEHRAPGSSPFGLLYYVHNEYITYLVAYGIVGLLFLLTLLGAFFVSAFHAADAGLKRYGFAVGAMFAVYLLAEDISYHPQLHGLFFFVLGLVFMSTSARATWPRRVPRDVPATANG